MNGWRIAHFIYWLLLTIIIGFPISEWWQKKYNKWKKNREYEKWEKANKELRDILKAEQAEKPSEKEE